MVVTIMWQKERYEVGRKGEKKWEETNIGETKKYKGLFGISLKN